MTYLFTKQGCGKCDWVKSHVDLESCKDVTVLQLDQENTEALALLAYYECVSLSEKKLPILVSASREIITGAGHIRKYLESNCKVTDAH
jgi:hypothetical protein